MKRGILLAAGILMMGSALFAQSHLSEPQRAAATETDPIERGGIIKGIVHTKDGKPAANVNIILKEIKRAVITGEDGSFTLRRLPAARYTVVVSHTGLQTQEKQVEVAIDQVTEMDIELAESGKQLDEVVVDGKKTLNQKTSNIGKLPVAVRDLPQSVAIISGATIAEQQSQRLSDVVKNINGVYMAASRAGTQETFSARGYGFSSNNMFRNGTRVNTGSMPEMSSLESVEVLKGSAAILYGNVAPGGVMNLVTKKPKFERGGEVSMRVGSYDLYKPSFDVFGPVSKNIAFRVNGTFESANSFRDSVSSKRYYVNPSLLFKLSPKTELLVQGDYLYHDFTPDFGIGSINNTQLSDFSRNTFLGAKWQNAKTTQATANINLKHHFNYIWAISGTASYQKYKRDYLSTERIQFNDKGVWKRPYSKQYTDEDYFAANIDVTAKFNTGSLNHTVLFGVDADRYFTTVNQYSLTNGGIYDSVYYYDLNLYTRRGDVPGFTQTGYTEAPVNRMGAYVQDLIKISDKFNFLAGLRFSYLENNAQARAFDMKGVQTKADSTKYETAISPRLGLVYKPTATTAVFASYSNSFTPNSGYDIDSVGLKPSIINQFELGVKNDFFQGMLSVNVTAYRIINSNLAQTAPFDKQGNPNTDTRYKELVGETTSDGVELDITGRPYTGFEVIAGYSYNNMRITKSPGSPGSYTVGDRLVQNPQHTANASVFYTFASNSKVKGLKFGASFYYIGERGAGWTNTKGQTQNYDRYIKVPGFSTVDFTAGYTYKQFSLLAKVSNIFNTYNYYVHENYSVNPIPPTQFVATLAYRFKY